MKLPLFPWSYRVIITFVVTKQIIHIATAGYLFSLLFLCLSCLISFCTWLVSVLCKHLYLLYASCSVKLTHIPVPFLYHSLPLEYMSCSFLPAHFLRLSSNIISSSNYFCPKCFSLGTLGTMCYTHHYYHVMSLTELKY